MEYLTKSGKRFKHFPSARYAVDVTFQQTHAPVVSFGEKRVFFSKKHALHGMKVEFNIIHDLPVVLHDSTWRVSDVEGLSPRAVHSVVLHDATMSDVPSCSCLVIFLVQEFLRYQAIQVHTKESVRILRLRNMFTRVEQAVTNNGHLYRLFVLNMTAFENAIKSGTSDGGLRSFTLPINDVNSGAFMPPDTVPARPPAKRKSKDDVNSCVVQQAITLMSTVLALCLANKGSEKQPKVLTPPMINLK
ncbi:hypothetical protein H257_06260 [Aphanomyces astaci]|uniref:Uncharacterized protein n=1 Tax=Aphanomyces astaci TaxID=112090 RepID=W4GM78_APHAT|nr:hypothetical protein H257_06260 [Aphanomyces astaci]ETV80777.1 hypothetical protein H257_06260 [Aphanomyces astaci]|eukprot:XP_009829724.1 hypothetical protein H257_06260 [Aphanomyces astaci]